jgi:hypothetical protein
MDETHREHNEYRRKIRGASGFLAGKWNLREQTVLVFALAEGSCLS